jgi:hypothetical protein
MHVPTGQTQIHSRPPEHDRTDPKPSLIDRQAAARRELR